MAKGFFITFEGPEGCGKTTHSRLLYEFLKKKGLRAIYTREPGGTKVGEKIRKMLLDPDNRVLSPLSELLLYMTARQRIVEEKILPALKEKKIVICDRFLDSSLAYQGYGGGLDITLIKKLGDLVTKTLRPDLTFLLDIDVGVGLSRLRSFKDRIERRPISYHNKVRRGYLALARKETNRIKVVAAEKSIQETQELIRKLLMKNCYYHRFTQI